MGRAEERRARQGGARRDKQKVKKKGIRRFFTWKKVLGTFFGLCLLAMGAFYVIYLMVPIPTGNDEAQMESNVYKLSNGQVLARSGTVNREAVSLEKVPVPIQHSFVALENKTFYDDQGVDFKGTTRGILKTLMGKGAQGGSTITQQYVKNNYLTQEQTVTRKLKEIVISLKVDQRYSKDEILAGYMNTSYYGRNAYGIQAAAQAYYGKDVSKLTLEEGTYLAALLQAPSQYDWQTAGPIGKQLVQGRWNKALDNMVEKKWLTPEERAKLKFTPPKDAKVDAGMGGQTGYLVAAAKAEVIRNGVDPAVLDRGGWTITLNIDPAKQKLLEGAVKAQLTSKLDPNKRKVDADLQAGAASVDPKTGSVVALYGGQDFLKHQLSNATNPTYQPASTFKPVILAAAFNQGAETQDGKQITANTVYNGDSRRPVKGSDIPFDPPNEDDASYGPVSVQVAMNKSINSVFAQMGVDAHLDKVRDTAVQMGMTSLNGLKPVPAMTLGSYGASPLQMAAVYATLDNHGKKVTPSIVKSAEHKDHKYDKPDPIGSQVISKQAADSVTSVLTGVVDDGTAQKSVAEADNRDGKQVAGKTGTSDDNKSAWFTGYTPDLVTSVGLWGEAAEPRVIKVDGKSVNIPRGGQVTMTNGAGEDGRINGGSIPARIWAAYTFDAVKGGAAKFDLDTDQGAAVEPAYTPSKPASNTPSKSASNTPSKSASKTPSNTPSNTPSTPTNSPSGTTSHKPKPPTPTASNSGGASPPVDPLNPNG
ncbi:transglycosylase domain-containing protein [Streptomyces violascens]|uniref:Penicillin-binding protein n=1 Tax=Streptomyces violascens TaxID=67381 RepID=A0ABQ3QLH7_9ACTN|nr:transglycosylase domain-containing protein [Streptomyces violascens]GGU36062.1 penicillin-binding protein [Streptomyces violascens]GHI38135.1 penicillin-binding protein [Streptomyces violascens]